MDCFRDLSAVVVPDVRLAESSYGRLVVLVPLIGLDLSGGHARRGGASVDYALVWTGVVAQGWMRRRRGRSRARLAAMVAGEDFQPWKSWVEVRVFGPGPWFGFFVGCLSGPSFWADPGNQSAASMEGEVYALPE